MRGPVCSRAVAKWAGSLSLVVLTGILTVTARASPEAMKALGIVVPRSPTAWPNVTLAGLDGRPFSFNGLKASVTLMNFWAAWCPPCEWETPVLERVYQAYSAKGFVVVAISLDREGPAAVERFVRERKLTYPVALDPSFEMAWQLGLVGLPATFLIGPDGLIKGMTYGAKEWDGPEGRAVIESLLRQGME